MKATLLQDGPEKTFALVFDTGEEVVAALLRFARDQQLTAAHLTAIGEITPDGHAILLAHDGYFNGRPKADRAILRLFADNNERIEAFRRGELDVVIAPGRRFTDDEARKHLFEFRARS